MTGIGRLKQYFTNYSICLEKIDSLSDDLVIRLSISDVFWDVIVEDEYNNYNPNNELLTLFLVLYSLETYKESSDFLGWCNELSLDTSNTSLLTYYQTLYNVIHEIEAITGEIDSYISAYDYSLQSGEFRTLLK